jgi:hypothetical protein
MTKASLRNSNNESVQKLVRVLKTRSEEKSIQSGYKD